MKPNNSAISVVLVEDDGLLRGVLESWLRHDGRFAIAGSYRDGETALDGIHRIKPALAIVDFGLSGMKGDKLIWRVKQEIPETKIIAISGILDNYVVLDALAAGADGFLDKPIVKAKFFEHLDDLLVGGHPLSKRAGTLLVDEWRKTVPHISTSLLALTDRERTVAEMVDQGLTHEAIATSLGISQRTAEEHVRHVYDKLHIHSRTQLQLKLHPPRG